jgi:hypothetical protein
LPCSDTNRLPRDWRSEIRDSRYTSEASEEGKRTVVSADSADKESVEDVRNLIPADVAIMQDFLTFIPFYLLALAIATGGFCCFLARAKDRDEVAWFFAGLFFSLIALIAIAGAPIRGEKEPDPYKYVKGI